jgi:hypothetical protein
LVHGGRRIGRSRAQWRGFVGGRGG